METTHDRGDKILTGPEPGDLVGLECVRVSTVESTRADTSERDREIKRAALTLDFAFIGASRRGPRAPRGPRASGSRSSVEGRARRASAILIQGAALCLG